MILWIIEDNPVHVRGAMTAAKEAGFMPDKILTTRECKWPPALYQQKGTSAVDYLEFPPDVMVLDLDFGQDKSLWQNFYAKLRAWRKPSECAIVVWSDFLGSPTIVEELIRPVHEARKDASLFVVDPKTDLRLGQQLIEVQRMFKTGELQG